MLQRPRSLSLYGAVAPIGLAYVAAAVVEAGHRVTVVDGAGEALDQTLTVDSAVGALSRTGLSDAQICARVPADADVIGLSHMFLHEWPMLRALLPMLRAACPRACLVLGGENASAHWTTLLEEAPPGVWVVRGEGEETFVRVLDCIVEGGDWQAIAGLAWQGEVGPQTSGLAARNTAMASLPRPAWSLFPVEAYLSQRDPHGVHRGRSLPILATRGCPYSCTFCSSPDMWTTRYLTRSPADVVDEMVDAVAQLGVENFNFCDLTAIVRRDWILEFCAALEAAKLDITWQLPTGTRSEALDADVLRALVRTGCRNLTYAPESGSERMLRILKKRVKPARMLESLAAAHEAGLVTRVNIIIGHPDENEADVRASAKLLLAAARAGCDDAAVMVFSPYPGSEDYHRLRDAGEIDQSDAWCYLALSRSGGLTRTWHPRWGPRRLHAVQLGLLTAFYVASVQHKPSRLGEAVGALRSGQERTQMDQLLRTKLGQARTRLAEVWASS